MENLLKEQIHGLYGAERQILSNLPAIINTVETSPLRDVLAERLSRTRDQVDRLQILLAHFGEYPTDDRYGALEGLLGEILESFEEHEGSPETDSVLIQVLQRITLYEMASYRTACTLAQELGYPEITAILADSLEEEKLADEELKCVAAAQPPASGVDLVGEIRQQDSGSTGGNNEK